MGVFLLKRSWLLLGPLLLFAQVPLEEKAAKAKASMEAGRFAEAAVLWGELVKAVPGNPGLLMNQGMALSMAGEDAKAVPILEAATKAGGPPPAFLFLGASYLRTGQPAKALAPLKRFVAADPRHVEVRLMLVDASTALGLPAEALPHLEALANLAPDRPAVWYQLARTYEELAYGEFSQLEKLFPESGPHFALLADSRSKVSQNRAAFFFYRKALEKSPKMRGLHGSIAEIYRRTGEPSWALSEDAAEVRLGEPACGVKTAECSFAAGDFAAVLRQSAKTADGFYWRVRAYDGLARKAFGRLGALPPSRESYRFAAETARDEGRFADAVAAWRLAGQGFETELVSALVQMKEYAAAQKEIDALMTRGPSPELNFLQGDLLLAQQEAEKAIPFLQKAVSLLPARAALARALMQAGRPAEALPHATAALPLDSDGSLHFQLARAYQAVGKPTEAAAAMAVYQKIKAQERVTDEQVKITPP